MRVHKANPGNTHNSRESTLTACLNDAPAARVQSGQAAPCGRVNWCPPVLRRQHGPSEATLLLTAEQQCDFPDGNIAAIVKLVMQLCYFAYWQMKQDVRALLTCS